MKKKNLVDLYKSESTRVFNNISTNKIVKFVGFIDVTKASVHYNYQT